MQLSRPTRQATASDVVMRLAALFVLQAGLIVTVKSAWFAAIVGREYDGQLHFGTFPVWFLFVLFVAFFWLHHREFRNGPSTRVADAQRAMAAACLFVALLGVAVFTHPTQWSAEILGVRGGEGPLTASLVASAIRYTLIVALLVPSAYFVFPATFLRQYARSFGVGLLLLVGYIWLGVVRIMLHTFVGPPILSICYALLSRVSPTAMAVPAELELKNGGFSVWIGPPCIGLDSIVMFALAYGFLCLHVARRPGFSTGRALWAFVAGVCVLLSLNILRIVGIMLVGSHSPGLGVELFHGAIGGAYFFAVFVMYVHSIFPRLIIRA